MQLALPGVFGNGPRSMVLAASVSAVSLVACALMLAAASSGPKAQSRKGKGDRKKRTKGRCTRATPEECT
ncbi:hypothetical protein DL89DRAFT_42063 [Linderina pennispora]|uniref:Uncharacterized protein n=1 Tax=Linderina pennispora TaxID=61395 RepID=A0A1Y1VU20_9FUNG|nr:uncharacterized protein DL89DRAFT_42063 [Linderina pennispora]ORX64244.1 hypothetical protein DL89DRAFT_42063 [Linderina pennispora]